MEKEEKEFTEYYLNNEIDDCKNKIDEIKKDTNKDNRQSNKYLEGYYEGRKSSCEFFLLMMVLVESQVKQRKNNDTVDFNLDIETKPQPLIHT